MRLSPKAFSELNFSKIGEKLRPIISLDLRSLALLRILMGILIIYDLINRSTDLVAFYTDFGVLPRAELLREVNDPWMASIHLLNGTWQVQLFLFFIAGFFGLLVMLGYRTRLVTIISWIFLISLQSRNGLVLSGADQVFRQVMFFAMFLPWGARYSLDSLHSKEQFYLKNSFTSFATIGYIFQIGFLYVFSSYFKTSPAWRSEGTAIYYALSLDAFATRLGLFMLQFPQLLKVQTFIVYWIEAYLPYFLLTPMYSGPIRTVVVLIFVGMHIGMGLHLALGIFPAVCVIAWCGILPPWFWDSFLPKLNLSKKLSQIQSFPLIVNMPILRKLSSTYFKNNRNQEEKDLKFYNSLLINGLVFISTIYILLWNITSLPENPKLIPKYLKWPASLFNIQQRWNMFSPSPPKSSGWFIITATLTDGSIVDLYTGKDQINWNKPTVVSEYYKNDRWHKYLENISKQKFINYTKLYADYLCRDWNYKHAKSRRVTSLSINYMLTITFPREGHTPPQLTTILHSDCQN